MGKPSVRKPSATNVAKAAGVSPATVDRVLNNRGGVSAEKERLVFEWARRLGLDRNLKSRPTRLIRIGVLIGPSSNPFYGRVAQAFARTNQLFFAANIQCTVTFSNYFDPSETLAQLARMRASCDAIVMISPEHASVSEALIDLSRTRPVVAMVTDLPDSNRFAYVGLDNAVSGRVAGDLMGRLLGREAGDVVLVTETQAMFALRERERGFREALAERHARRHLVEVIETSDPDRAGELLRDAIARRPAIAGVYVVSTGNRSIAGALTALGRLASTVVITHEMTPARRALLRSGAIDAIIDQNPEFEAQTAVELLAHHFGRLESAPSQLTTPFTLFFRENS